MRQAQASPFFVGRLPRHLGNECGGCGDLQVGQRSALRIEIVEGQVAVGLDHDGSAAQCLRPDTVGKPLFENEGEVVIRVGLRKQIAHERGLPRPSHPEQDRELRRAGKEIADTDQVVIRSIVKRFGAVEVPREGGGERKQIGEPFVQA